MNRNRSKTFKPKKHIKEGTKQYQLKKYAEATLGSGNLRLAVTLPEGEDLNEWLAVNSTTLTFSSVSAPFLFLSLKVWCCLLSETVAEGSSLLSHELPFCVSSFGGCVCGLGLVVAAWLPNF